MVILLNKYKKIDNTITNLLIKDPAPKKVNNIMDIAMSATKISCKICKLKKYNKVITNLIYNCQ